MQTGIKSHIDSSDFGRTSYRPNWLNRDAFQHLSRDHHHPHYRHHHHHHHHSTGAILFTDNGIVFTITSMGSKKNKTGQRGSTWLTLNRGPDVFMWKDSGPHQWPPYSIISTKTLVPYWVQMSQLVTKRTPIYWTLNCSIFMNSQQFMDSDLILSRHNMKLFCLIIDNNL